MPTALSARVYGRDAAAAVLDWFKDDGAPLFEIVSAPRGVRIKAESDILACAERAIQATAAADKALNRELRRHHSEERRIAKVQDDAMRREIAAAKRSARSAASRYTSADPAALNGSILANGAAH